MSSNSNSSLQIGQQLVFSVIKDDVQRLQILLQLSYLEGVEIHRARVQRLLKFAVQNNCGQNVISLLYNGTYDTEQIPEEKVKDEACRQSQNNFSFLDNYGQLSVIPGSCAFTPTPSAPRVTASSPTPTPSAPRVTAPSPTPTPTPSLGAPTPTPAPFICLPPVPSPYPGKVILSELEKEEYSSDSFRMYDFKVVQCNNEDEHDWMECPFAHAGEKACRRDPRKFNYVGTACPDFRKGSCKRGDACGYAHGVFECWLHPSRYRTQLCQAGMACNRKVCFFAHHLKQLRTPEHQPFKGHTSAILQDNNNNTINNTYNNINNTNNSIQNIDNNIENNIGNVEASQQSFSSSQIQRLNQLCKALQQLGASENNFNNDINNNNNNNNNNSSIQVLNNGVNVSNVGNASDVMYGYDNFLGGFYDTPNYGALISTMQQLNGGTQFDFVGANFGSM